MDKAKEAELIAYANGILSALEAIKLSKPEETHNLLYVAQRQASQLYSAIDGILEMEDDHD